VGFHLERAWHRRGGKASEVICSKGESLGMVEFDRQQIAEAIINSQVGPAAREEGSRLVESWLESFDNFPEKNWRVRFVEAPFFIRLQPKTWILGQMDACFHDGEHVVLGEWKSRRAPKLKKDGTSYLGDDEQGWLEEITNGPQLGVYALAGREGTFITDTSQAAILDSTLNLEEPHILVRAAVKSNPVEFWSGRFSFPGALLDTVRAALISEAESIRARRKAGHVPYSVPGIHCQNMYRRTCEYLETVCKPRLTPPLTPIGWHHPEDKAPDPGYDVCELLGLDIQDPELVVLSQSALQSNYQCAERARIDYGGYFAREVSFELEVGTALHTGLKEIYRQLLTTGN